MNYSYAITTNQDNSRFHVSFAESREIGETTPFGSVKTATSFTIEKVIPDAVFVSDTGRCAQIRTEIVHEGVILGIPPKVELLAHSFPELVQDVEYAISASVVWLNEDKAPAIAGEIASLLGDDATAFVFFAERSRTIL